MVRGIRQMARTVDSAEILETAGVGFRLSLLLNAVGCEVFSAGAETHSIAKGISLFAVSLKHAGQLLQEPGSTHTPEAVRTMKDISKQGAEVFEQIESMLDKTRKAGGDSSASNYGSLQERFLRYFKKHHVTYLLAHIESLKLNLMVMIQIINLGKLIAAQRYMEKHLAADLIQQERIEIQNMIIVRYWSFNRLARMYDLAARESMENNVVDGQRNPATDLSNPQGQNGPLLRIPLITFGDVDTTLTQVKQSPRDMVQISGQVINSLLKRWTRQKSVSWKLPADTQKQGSPAMFDSERMSDTSSSGDEEGVRGYYLEGTTTNWREPRSQDARKYAADLRKRYSGLQARAESDSEISDGPVRVPDNSVRGSDGNNYRSFRHDNENTHESFSTASREKIPRYQNQEYNNADSRASKSLPIPVEKQGSSNHRGLSVNTHNREVNVNSSPSNSDTWKIPMSPGTQRHDQQQQHGPPGSSHIYSSSPSQNHHISSSSYGSHLRPHNYPPKPTSHARQTSTPYRYATTNSQSDRRRPPTTASLSSSPTPHHHSHHSGRSRHSTHHKRRSSPSDTSSYDDSHDDEKERDKERDRTRHRNLKRSATKGLLGAGAIAGFLEALEKLSI